MIGFDDSFKQFRNKRDEGPDTKKLQKHELYEEVTKIWMLPPLESKGLTREYLLRVRDDEVFRVTTTEYKHFEVNLNKKQQKKVGIVNNALLVRKLNILLKSKGQKDLGFTEYNLPDQDWLYKVARFIDASNIMEFFEAPAGCEPPLSRQSSDISKIYYGRVFASQKFFNQEDAKKNKPLFKALQTLSEKHRTLLSSRVNVEVLVHELEEAKRKTETQERELHDLVGKISFSYTALIDRAITPELVISKSQNLSLEQQDLLHYNQRL